MPYLYTGKLVWIDLSRGKWRLEEVSEGEVQNYLLGSGLAAKILYEEMDPALDPLDPANPIFFIDGLLTGSIAPAACRLSVCGRSPLTGIWNESLVGGYWGLNSASPATMAFSLRGAPRGRSTSGLKTTISR